MKKISIENRLITLNPGTYLCAGKEDPLHVELERETTGLIIKSTKDTGNDASLLTVLVGDRLINVWADQQCT